MLQTKYTEKTEYNKNYTTEDRSIMKENYVEMISISELLCK